MATDTAPASSAEASQTDELDSTPSTPTLAPTHENYMAHDISEADDVRAFDQPDADLPPLPTEEDDSIIHHVIEEEDAHNDERVD